MPLKPICVPCERFYRPKKNGFSFLEGMPNQITARSTIKAGKNSPGWVPYKLWQGDIWECPDCGAQIVVGTGLLPIAEHYQQEFEDQVKLYAAKLLVKDC